MLKCRCGGHVIYADDEVVCGTCGEVQSTKAGFEDAMYNTLQNKRFGKSWKLHNLDRIICRPSDRIRLDIESICTKCGAPDVVYRRALSIYGNSVSHGLHRGWHHAALAAAVVSLACRIERVPRTTKSICVAAMVKPCSMHRIYNTIADVLSLNIPPPEPATFVSGVGTACNIPEPVLRKAVELLRMVQSQMSGKDPATLAAAALYMVCTTHHRNTTQQQIADAANVSTVSMRLRRQDIERAMS